MRRKSEARKALNFRRKFIPRDEKSDTETWFWLMRGAQPATSAGARLFAGSPIPAFLTTLQRSGEEINLELAAFQLTAREVLSEIANGKFTHLRVNVLATHLLIARDKLCLKISELTPDRLGACLQLKSLD